MSKVMISLILLAVALALANPVMAGGNKVEVCHIPPGNPDNIHTITISENALSAHLAHGDLEGSCNALCAALCDDGNACTIDDTGDCEHGCPAPAPVDCDDGVTWTADTCNTNDGLCVNTRSLCPCWNGDDTRTPAGVVNLAEFWTVMTPPECSVTDECSDITSEEILIGNKTEAKCFAALGGQQEGTVVRLTTSVIDQFFVPFNLLIRRCGWTPIFSNGQGGGSGTSKHIDLTEDEVAICEAEHDAFTAGITFPAGITTNCRLPTPGACDINSFLCGVNCCDKETEDCLSGFCAPKTGGPGPPPPF